MGRNFILIDSNNRESASEILVFILEDIDKNLPLERRKKKVRGGNQGKIISKKWNN